MHDPLSIRDLLADELDQRRQAGFEIGEIEPVARRALEADPVTSERVLEEHLDALERSARTEGWGYVEVDPPGELVARAEGQPLLTGRRPPARELADRLRGAWLGRCAGCLLGKPVEGWSAAHLRTYLRGADAWPLDGYVPRIDPYPVDAPPMKPSWVEATRGAIQGMPRDDDLDYTVVGLLVLERTGGRPSPDDVADEWLARLPIGRLFTAERAAYRNLVLGFRPPDSATYRNPYREWIGALIRVDAYAYVHPGDPLSAARLAASDASLSHVGNGVAAAMWAAAIISLALAGVGPAESVPAASALVPAGSRLRTALDPMIAMHRAGSSWEAALDELEAIAAGYGWVHAIPNVAIIAASLLWGEGDFGRSIALAVMAGRDTDSNAATVGSATGALVGAAGIPRSWTDSLGDTLRTAVAGVGSARISELAARTLRLAEAAGAE